MRTPAQAYGHPRFADDYPWDGGYGEGERRSACRNAKEITAQRPGGPCSGILPSWITNYPSGMLSGISLQRQARTWVWHRPGTGHLLVAHAPAAAVDPDDAQHARFEDPGGEQALRDVGLADDEPRGGGRLLSVVGE